MNIAMTKPAVSSLNSKSQSKKPEQPKEHIAPVDRPWRKELHCVVPENTIVVSAITLYQLARLLTVPITLSDSIKMTTRAMGNFIHPRFISEHGLVTREHTPLVVNNVNGRLLLCMDQQVEIRMVLGSHLEMLTFDVAPLGKHNIILGLPWLQQHNLTIHWSSGKITFVSDYCEEHCLTQPASTFLNQRPIVPMVSVKSKASEIVVEPLSEEEVDIFVVEIPEHLELVAETILDPYHVEINVFDGQKAVTVLPPLHGPDVDFAIELDKSKPLPKPSHPYQMNQEECAKCHKLLDDRVNAGIMEPADPKCPIATPMFFMWKKDGTQWPVINYQKLNKITVKDSYLLPCIDEMMDRLQGSEFFTKFDLKSGYNQIRTQPGNEWKTTFMTPFGLYRMKVMTFGFANAPPCFQQYMDKVFMPLLYKGVEIYLDDILMHHKTKLEHIEGVLSVLQCLENARLYCNLKKCEFHWKKMEFLSVNISSNGFEMEDKKIADVCDWECPTSV